MHPFTNLPLGTLAGDALREVRNRCKKPFERIWQENHMGRSQAYRWLAEHLGKSIAQCHFGLFEAPECERAAVLCTDYLSTDKRQAGTGGNSAMASAFKTARVRRGE
jgi:hypothetical protein